MDWDTLRGACELCRRCAQKWFAAHDEGVEESLEVVALGIPVGG